jgi:hypothetical protein
MSPRFHADASARLDSALTVAFRSVAPYPGVIDTCVRIAATSTTLRDAPEELAA